MKKLCNNVKGLSRVPERRDRRPTRLKAATLGMIEQADVNRQRALALRLPPHRLSYGSIARKLGVSRSTAYEYVNSAHAELLGDIAEKKSALRHLENETLDVLIERWLPIALDVRHPDALRACDRVARLIEQRCRINGLLQPDNDGSNQLTLSDDVFRFIYNNGNPIGSEKSPTNDERSTNPIPLEPKKLVARRIVPPSSNTGVTAPPRLLQGTKPTTRIAQSCGSPAAARHCRSALVLIGAPAAEQPGSRTLSACEF